MMDAVAYRNSPWSEGAKVGFRFCFSFFFLQIVLFALNFLIGIFTLSSRGLHFLLFFDVANCMPYLGVCLILAVLIAGGWSYFDRHALHYRPLYYWIRVVVRYRLAIGMFAYGFIKLFPIQMPAPTLSDLNTAYGDFLPWKIFWLTTGAASAGYESALGILEIIAGSLLLFRVTTSFGALLALLTLANALGVNIAYQTGQYVHSVYFIALAVFLIAYDIPRLYRLLILEKPVLAGRSPGIPITTHYHRVKQVLKLIFAVGVMGYAYLVYTDYQKGPYLLPQNKGVAELYGYYEVIDFELNGEPIPYSLTDPNRWQNVVFEKWTTVSIKRALPVNMDWTKKGFTADNDLDRNYESSGTVGRHYFHYEADTVRQRLSLQHKNKHHRSETWNFDYIIDPEGLLTLSGTDSFGNSVNVVLEKINRRYLLQEGRRKPIKLAAFN